MDGAGFVSRFIYLTLPHLARAITVVILIQTIFLLGVYRRDPGHHQRRPGLRLAPTCPSWSTSRRSLEFDIGAGLGRRHHRRHPRQHRRHLPDARRRQEPRQVEERRSWPAQSPTSTRSIVTVAAWVVALLIFFPILWTIITSFKTEAEAIAGLQPDPVAARSRTTPRCRAQYDYFKPFMNSVILSLGSTLLGAAHRRSRGLVDGLLADHSAPRTS